MADSPPSGPPPRNFGQSLEQIATSPGARKEKVRQREYRRARRGRHAARPYVELHAASAFSFLDGASQPEDLVARAAELDLPAVALIDTNGVYGAPRFYRAAREAGIKALVGAEVVLGETAAPIASGRGPIGLVPDPERPEPKIRAPSASWSTARKAAALERQRRRPRLSLLVADRTGYRNLCRLLTAAARGRPKGLARTDWATLKAHSEGLVCLAGGERDPLRRTLEADGLEAARRRLDHLRSIFADRLYLEIGRHGQRAEEHVNQALVDLSRDLRIPLVATNGVRYAGAQDKALYDVMTAIREHTHLDAAGALLEANRERHLKGAREMSRLFADLPGALETSVELGAELDFTLADLGYRFPDYPLPPGETPISYLRQVAWNGARARFRPLSAKAQDQIEKELAVIEKLDLAGYFLIVWDIVGFCQKHGILAQGRGSAANSAVCYALSITAVDPVKMGLLFERFLSEERGEWPDIDLDLPSGDRRESVIQYVYQRYGPHGAAMTANVITYRDRSATREVAKALGFSPAQIDKLAKRLGTWGYDSSRGDPKSFDEEIRAAGLDPDERRMRIFGELWRRIHHMPRHLGQHSGGMVIAAGRLDEVVPLEPSAMPDRVVVQWDKDDCADLGIVKVDLLGLGMLNALEEAVPLIQTKEGRHIDLAHLPPDDPKTFAMIREADTVGVFQIESRAQMSSLPRHAPECFYDLVVQVAIIRPGPIVGGMVNPFFNRRLGREEVTYAHPSLEPILERTLGVPLFQEQILRIAMVAAGFTGGEAEELRRAMGFKRSVERMDTIEKRLRSGMSERGIDGAAQDQIVKSITSFALYGFPESHAASFALIAYASAYLKAHHPAAFYVALLNAWPMGFYHPATLVKDAQRHGVKARPIDVLRSGWSCRWEAHRDKHRPPGAIRLGLRYVRGLKREQGEAIEAEATRQPFLDLADLTRRTKLPETALSALAESGALASLGLGRRQALWQVAWITRSAGPLLEQQKPKPSPLTEMSSVEETLADYSTTGLTVGDHPMCYFRRALSKQGVLQAATLEHLAPGQRVRTAGSVIVRQRPGTAKGMLFITLEDETGMSQAIVTPDLLRKKRSTIVGTAGLIVEGILESRDGAMSVKADKIWPLDRLAETPSHDFH